MCCQYIVDNADTAMVSVAKGGWSHLKTGPDDKPLFEALMGDPGQMLSLGELELPPILSPSIHTNAPGPTIAEYRNNSL